MSMLQQVHDDEAAPIAQANPSSAEVMLLDFLREHDAACPVCGYNVRALTRPVCPECRHDLILTVGVARLRLGWLLAAIAPGFFSGIAACFVLIPIIARVILGDGVWTPALIAVDLFGFLSGGLAITLAFRTRLRSRFLALPRSSQRTIAIAIWLLHITALVLFIVVGPAFM